MYPMAARIEAGTDVAMIGAWDASRNDAVIAKRWGKEWDRILEDDVAQGHLFLIHTGADCSGQIDVYWDTEVPPEARAHTRPIVGEFLICVPTGRLMVGGVEDYRSDKPKITGEDSIVDVPSGNYALRCFVGTEENGSDAPVSSQLEKALGSDDYRYSRSMTRRGCLGYFTLLLYPLLAFPFGWKVALPSTVVILLAYLYIHDRALKRSVRYQRILRMENEVFRDARKKESPAFVFELRRLEGVTDLKGGSVWLTQRRQDAKPLNR